MRGVSYSNRKAASTAQQAAMAGAPLPPRRPVPRSGPGSRTRRRFPAREPRPARPFVGEGPEGGGADPRGTGPGERRDLPLGYECRAASGGPGESDPLGGNGAWGRG